MIKNLMENYAKKKVFIMLFGTSSFGCILFPLAIVAFLTMFFIFVPLMFDNALANDESDYSEMQEKLDSRISLIQVALKLPHPSVTIDGPLIAATVEIVMTYNNSLDLTLLDDEMEETEIINDNRFPSYKDLYKMAEGMIGTRVIITCVEDDVPEGETANSYSTSYVKELVGIDEYKEATCRTGYTSDESLKREEDVISIELYEKKFLREYFTLEETLGLDPVDDLITIKSYAAEVLSTYDSYMALVYGKLADGEFSVGGYEYVDNVAIVTDNGALPVNLDIPVYGTYINSPFGMRYHPTLFVYKFHTGLDLHCTGGESLHSVFDGVVILAEVSESYGNYVKVKHDLDNDGIFEITTLYAHMDSLATTLNKKVSAGDKIGYCGTTGRSTGPHLHFEMILNTVPESECYEPYYWGGKCFKNPKATLEAIGKKVFSL